MTQVVGAPLIAIMLARLPRRPLVVGLMGRLARAILPAASPGYGWGSTGAVGAALADGGLVPFTISRRPERKTIQ